MEDFFRFRQLGNGLQEFFMAKSYEIMLVLLGLTFEFLV